MLSPWKPDGSTVERLRRDVAGLEPTATVADPFAARGHHDSVTRSLGWGVATFQRARDGLMSWAAHAGSGVEVEPRAAPTEGATVTLVTRQLGIWVLAACRIERVVDDPMVYGFTYATLPGHPEQGFESFTVSRSDNDAVTFSIEASSRPAGWVMSALSPVARVLQIRMTNRYLDALGRWVGE